MNLGIIVALPDELKSLTGKHLKTGDSLELAQGIHVMLAGMGAQNAATASEHMAETGAQALMSWGCAAGLDPSLVPGDLVIPEAIIGADLTRYPTDSSWRNSVSSTLPSDIITHNGTLAESPDVLSTMEDKKLLADKTHAIAADMESAAIAQVAQNRNIPFLAIRTISDCYNECVPATVTSSMGRNGQVSIMRLLMSVAIRPNQWAALINLGRGFTKARKTLERVAACTGQDFGISMISPNPFSQP